MQETCCGSDDRTSHIVHFAGHARSSDVLEYPVRSAVCSAAQSYLSNRQAFKAASPRFAATVMLLQGDVGDFTCKGTLEVFMMRRVASMAFVPESTVFPGGGVDDSDYLFDAAWVGPSPLEWAALMGCSERIAKGVVVAAVRELFEECGVLLAGFVGGVHACSELDARWSNYRRRLISREISLAQFFLESDLSLRSDLLVLRSHWLTPVFEKRRYDTYFFSAMLPDGQMADDKTSEADIAAWISPCRAIERGESGEVSLALPTAANLAALIEAIKAGKLFERRAVNLVMPEPMKINGEMVVRCVQP